MIEEGLTANSPELRQAVADLIAAAGFRGEFSLYRLAGGANNKVYRVEVNGSSALLKAYFQHPDDPRDRLESEFSFSRFAWANGVRSVPQPLACDRDMRLGLYEFVQGWQLLPSDITDDMMEQALSFYHKLNRHKQLPGAAALPCASEACFSIAEHLGCVERRLQSLQNVDSSSTADREAAGFIRGELTEAWMAVVNFIRREAGELGLTLDREIPQQDRCLSPSDFGFHNALLTPNGRLRYIDFEYAGWDDPAKMICDFFCQPAVPVPLDYYDMFTESVVSDLSEPEIHRQRAALLLPVHRIKWCCILLNEFLPVGNQRRHFAGETVDREEQKLEQLHKARKMLQSLNQTALVGSVSH